MHKKTVQVKLSGDGTIIGGQLHKQPESYDCLKLALEDIIKEVEELKEVHLDGNTFKIEYYLGGDWKFLAMVTSIDAASSDYACICGKCKKDDCGDIQQQWSLCDKYLGARTIEENIELASRISFTQGIQCFK